MREDQSPETMAVREWIRTFSAALADGDPSRVSAQFAEEAFWRDLVAFTWDIGWIHGSSNIAQEILRTNALEESRDWSLAPERAAPRRVSRAGREVIEAFIAFRTRVGRAVGVLRLDADHPALAQVLLTRLEDIADPPHLYARPRPAGVGYDRSSPRNWLDVRREAQDYSATRSPQVLVVGGGHSGIFAAANLQRLGIDTLVVDRLPRPGDNWRTRYDALALHNPADMVQFPYLPFPDSFPEYIPKDQLANWMESYVDAMEINFWGSTNFLGGEYDESLGRWKVAVERGTERIEFTPTHVVIATGGVGGPPRIPRLTGMKTFGGSVVHTKEFASGADYAGMNVLVVGVGSSGHDVALDLHQNGARATMLQRNATSVVSLDSANLSYPAFTDGTPTAEADLLSSAGFIHPLIVESFRQATAVSNDLDRELLEGLRRAGLRIDDGEQGAGWLLKFYERGGGYYINVGCSEEIIKGTIGILQSEQVATFVERGVRLTDGSEVEFDAVVLATGYQNQQVELTNYFGEEVAARVGSVSGFDADGELRNAWRPTAQKGLWMMVSGFAPARNHASLVALQIRADLDGLSRVPRRITHGVGQSATSLAAGV